jgi:hypothetical protein
MAICLVHKSALGLRAGESYRPQALEEGRGDQGKGRVKSDCPQALQSQTARHGSGLLRKANSLPPFPLEGGDHFAD